MSQFLTTKEVAQFLSINEKMVYSLVSEKGLPASKITGKWLFPKNLVEQWVEVNTTNYPSIAAKLFAENKNFFAGFTHIILLSRHSHEMRTAAVIRLIKVTADCADKRRRFFCPTDLGWTNTAIASRYGNTTTLILL